MKILVPWSGGKDSQATLIWVVEKYGSKNVTAVFCDTKWEHEKTYGHVQLIPKMLGVELIIVSSKKYDGFLDLAKKKGRFPSSQVGFCTEELKIKPMIDYVLSLNEHVLIFQGIRADESAKRSKMFENCTFFKYYFEPYKTNSMIVEKYSSKLNLSLVQRKNLEKAKARLAIGKEDPKLHTYRKKEVFTFCEKFSDDIQRPFFKSTAEEVISYSLSRDYPINPLYFKGSGRVGCYPCKNVTLPELKRIFVNTPETKKKLIDAENETGRTFFSPDKVPVRYRSTIDPKSGKRITKIQDVIKYLDESNATADMFENEKQFSKCQSVYNICE